MRPMLLCQLLAGWLSAAALATTVHDESFAPDHVLRVTTATIPVACESRLSVVVNGTSPGPTIRLTPGVATWIRVYNDMSDQNLTMHWHGVAQRMAPFADGSPLASQWPIPPGHFFDYEIQADASDAGTYFYHSHIGLQALTCAGALIVDDCGTPPFPYDEERTLLFGDYFNQSEANMIEGLEAVPFKWSGETNAVLLNGRGIGLGHTSVAGSSDCGLPVVDVDPGKTYRFRIIGATGLSFTSLALEGHGNFTVIQADGGDYNVPVSVDHMQFGSGQRFDVLFKAKTTEELQSEGRETYYFQWKTGDRPSVYTGYGVLRYQQNVTVPAAPETAPFDVPDVAYDWLEYSLTPLDPAQCRAPTAAEVTRRITIASVQLVSPTTNQTVWQLANLSWTQEVFQKPVLVDIYQRGDAAVPNWDAAQRNHGWDPATLSFPVRLGEVLEIVLQNTGSLVSNGGGVDSHPFHAHGQHYYDIGSGNGTYDAVANDAKIQQLGYRPVRRDTTILHRYESTTTAGAAAGWRAWRIRVTEPGVWMVHCHILAHMIMGMQSVWVVGNAEQIMKIPLEESQGYFTYGGDVYGTENHDPALYQYFQGNSSQCASPSNGTHPGKPHGGG